MSDNNHAVESLAAAMNDIRVLLEQIRDVSLVSQEALIELLKLLQSGVEDNE